MSLQLDMIPCRIRRFQPFPKQATANAFGFAVAEDGLRYIVKSNGINPLVCANEWVCTSVAEFLHLPVAPCKVLQFPDGQLAFGTAVIDPRLSDIEAAQILLSKGLRNDLIVPELLPLVSSIYAFDLFIGNYDRHERNFIFSLESLSGSHGKIARIRAIDYDAANILDNADFDLPLSAHSSTVSTGRKIRQAHGFDIAAATTTLDRIYKGRNVMFERAMIGMPEEWLPDAKKQELQNWASASGLENRIGKLTQGLGNGTYL